MKAKNIRFYKPEDNSVQKETKPATEKKVVSTGYISGAGKLVFPMKSVEQLGLRPEEGQFMVGTQEGKRKIKSLYLVPAGADSEESFAMDKAAKSYTISLGTILQKGKIDYANTKYTFVIKPFSYEEGVTAYELLLDDATEKVQYTGKPRGRKPKNTEV
ncbi:hypothetical protein [Spirosoma rhododendri]|uniref:Uncharacterized protein n=1 Tax=Spirosoma rhododendri TaxID=2728024 RepID=A0A7L5DQ17_9BACT|nr:hypothetical protein [Spirosoma rhododendri]QJD80529.1 hypothetical protein HH216_20470 [Spirosoma rhododendri]